MEVIYALCLNERQLETAQACVTTRKLAMPPPGINYVQIYEFQTPEWEEGHNHTLSMASKGGESLLLRRDRFGQLELRVFVDGKLARDLFFYETWQRVTGQPCAWEAAVFGCAIGQQGDEEPYGGATADVEAALRSTLKLP